MRYHEIIRETRLTEAADYDEYALYKRGEADGLKGPADSKIFELPRDHQDAYFRGYDRAVEDRKLTKAQSVKVRIAIPAILKGIKRSALNAAYVMLVQGHATDNVRKIEQRDHAEAVQAITDALNALASQFTNGTIILYRTIQTDDAKAWVLAHMSKTQRLGRFWSSNENFVMAHAEAERVMFCVNAPVAAIDWPETIVLTVDGVEDEVRLREGAFVRLQYVEPAPYEFKPEPRQTV
jgi:hypothetical protein